MVHLSVMQFTKRYTTALLIIVASFMTGCRTFIKVPSPNKQTPTTTVYLIQYNGFHNALAFNTTTGITEYSFGDWHYYALDKHTLFNITNALFFKTKATLAKKEIVWDKKSLQTLKALINTTGVCKYITPITVNAQKSEALFKQITQRYQHNIHTQAYNRARQMYYVKEETTYTLGYNCNHLVSQWLTFLGCDVTGNKCLPRFIVESPSPSR